MVGDRAPCGKYRLKPDGHASLKHRIANSGYPRKKIRITLILNEDKPRFNACNSTKELESLFRGRTSRAKLHLCFFLKRKALSDGFVKHLLCLGELMVHNKQPTQEPSECWVCHS